MKCPICNADSKFVREYEAIQHEHFIERRKYCRKCSSAWKTMEQIATEEEIEKARLLKQESEI